METHLQYNPDITKRQIRHRMKKAGPPGPSLGELVGLVPMVNGWDNLASVDDMIAGVGCLSPRGHLIQILRRDSRYVVYRRYFPGGRAQTCQEDIPVNSRYYLVSGEQLEVLKRVWRDSLSDEGAPRQGDEIRDVLISALENGPVNIKEFAEQFEFSYGSVNTQRRQLEEVDRIIVKVGRGTYRLKG